MDDLADKIKNLKKSTEQYKNRREAERKNAREEADEKRHQDENEKAVCLSKIKEVESGLAGIDFEIEDTAPFHSDPHTQMGKRYILVQRRGSYELLIRVYSGHRGNSIEGERRPEEFNLDIIKKLCDRLPIFVEVATHRIEDALK